MANELSLFGVAGISMILRFKFVYLCYPKIKHYLHSWFFGDKSSLFFVCFNCKCLMCFCWKKRCISYRLRGRLNLFFEKRDLRIRFLAFIQSGKAMKTFELSCFNYQNIVQVHVYHESNVRTMNIKVASAIGLKWIEGRIQSSHSTAVHA